MKLKWQSFSAKHSKHIGVSVDFPLTPSNPKNTINTEEAF
jgi:hypothetical protein